jgi:hypothetical protein
VRDRILNSHDYRADINKQGIVNAINTEFELDQYNTIKKTIFDLSQSPFPSGAKYVQDIFGYYQDISGVWQSLGPQIWSEDYSKGKQNKTGFLVWQQEKFSNIDGYKNYRYSNLVEVFRELDDNTKLKFEYYIESIDEYNNSTLVKFTDMDNPSDSLDQRYTYRSPKTDLSISGNAIVYNLNDIPDVLKTLYYTEDGYPTNHLYRIKEYINKKYKHTWGEITDKSCIWDVQASYGSGQIPSFYDAIVPENYYKSSIYYSGLTGGIESLTYSLYPDVIESTQDDSNIWYLKIYPGSFYIDGISFYYFESPNINYLNLNPVTNGDYSGLYSGIMPSGLQRGAYTILANSGYFDDTYYCNLSRDPYLSGAWEDANYNVGLDGDKLWSDIYKRVPFLTTEMGLKTEINLGQYSIDLNSGIIYLNVPDSSFNEAVLIYEEALTPSGSYLQYDLNPLNDQNLSLESFFMFLSLGAGYIGSFRPPPVPIPIPPISGSILGWWKGEDNTVDSVNGNDAIWVNGTSRYTAGVVGQCFSCYQGAGNIEIPNHSRYAFKGTDTFYIEFYFNVGDEPYTYHPYFQRGNGLIIYWRTDEEMSGFEVVINGASHFITCVWSEGTFYKLKLEHTPSPQTWTLYLDDVNVGSFEEDMYEDNTNNYVFDNYSDDGYTIDIDEIKIYGSVITV